MFLKNETLRLFSRKNTYTCERESDGKSKKYSFSVTKNGVGRLYCMDKNDKLVNCLKNK